MPLINTLRENSNKKDSESGGSKQAHSTIGEDKDANEKTSDLNTKPMETICMPPSFYDDDIEKWKKKFVRSIKEREI